MNVQTIKILKSLADDTRLSMVRHLASKSQPVPGDQLVSSCSLALNLSQPTMSHHFKKLVDSGVVTENKIGTAKHYQLNLPLLEEIGINATKL